MMVMMMIIVTSKANHDEYPSFKQLCTLVISHTLSQNSVTMYIAVESRHTPNNITRFLWFKALNKKKDDKLTLLTQTNTA